MRRNAYLTVPRKTQTRKNERMRSRPSRKNERNGMLQPRKMSQSTLLRHDWRVAHPDLVETLCALLLRRDDRIARLRRLRRARSFQRLDRRRRICRVVKPRHSLDIERHTADKIGNTGLKWISSNQPQQFRRRHHRDCRIDKSRFIACYNDIRASGKRGTTLNLILKVICEICYCISNSLWPDGNYR